MLKMVLVFKLLVHFLSPKPLWRMDTQLEFQISAQWDHLFLKYRSQTNCFYKNINKISFSVGSRNTRLVTWYWKHVSCNNNYVVFKLPSYENVDVTKTTLYLRWKTVHKSNQKNGQLIYIYMWRRFPVPYGALIYRFIPCFLRNNELPKDVTFYFSQQLSNKKGWVNNNVAINYMICVLFQAVGLCYKCIRASLQRVQRTKHRFLHFLLFYLPRKTIQNSNISCLKKFNMIVLV